MEVLLRIAIGVGGATLGGALAGFASAILTLVAKGGRNRWLVARGKPGYTDSVLPLSFVMLCALCSLVLGAVLCIFLSPRAAVLIGALAPAGALTVLSLVGAAAQAFAD